MHLKAATDGRPSLYGAPGGDCEQACNRLQPSSSMPHERTGRAGKTIPALHLVLCEAFPDCPRLLWPQIKRLVLLQDQGRDRAQLALLVGTVKVQHKLEVHRGAAYMKWQLHSKGNLPIWRANDACFQAPPNSSVAGCSLSFAPALPNSKLAGGCYRAAQDCCHLEQLISASLWPWCRLPYLIGIDLPQRIPLLV